LVRRAVVALNGVGQHPDIGSYSFCTDGSAIVPYLAAHPERTCQVIGFGPSKEELAHIINEFVEVEQLHQALAGYVAIGAELLRR
jgi:acetylornithine deacetylase/succinyl-diaminopimelate desuccinylase-like protein